MNRFSVESLKRRLLAKQVVFLSVLWLAGYQIYANP